MPVSRRLILGAALAAPAAVRRAGAEPSPLAFGALYPFSGPLALLGDESYRGLELAVEDQNAAGGVLNRPIKLLKGDAVDANQAVTEARRLTGAEKVAAIFGTTASALVFAASQVSELAGTPYFELGAISDPVTERGFKYLFRSCPLASAFAELSIDAVIGSLAPRWGLPAQGLKLAVLHEDSLYGSTISGFQLTRCAELSLNVVEHLSYGAGSADLGNIVPRLREAAAEVVLHTGYQNDTILFFRQMKQVGWRPRMVVGAGGGYSLADTASAIGPDFDGAISVDVTQYGVNEAAAPGVREVQAAYEKKYGAKPRSGHSLANYVGAKLFLDAVNRAASLDKDRIRAAVLAADVPVGTTATGWGAKFDDKGQNTRAMPVLLQWQGGVLLTVAPAHAAMSTLTPRLGP
ncbi:MAG: ABC transporter substrate-binding protein [Acetobacteraceae bacterium]